MNNSNSSDKYLRTKIFLAKITGILVLIVSMQFSQNGFGFKDEDIAMAGWVLAVAVTVAQFVFNSRVRNLNWTITFLGIMAYVYSIWTNLIGFYNYQGKTLSVETLLTFNALLPVFASAFMDIFPEAILSWAFNSSGEGDLIGNVIAVTNDPNSIFSKNQNNINTNPNQNNSPNSRNNNPQNNSNQQHQRPQNQTQSSLMSNIPRNNTKTEVPMGYTTPTMDDKLRAELMKNIEDMKNKS